MFIQTEETPNPQAMKFLPGRTVMPSGSLHIADASESWRAPLAEALFDIEGVKHVFFGNDFVSVTKAEDYPWSLIKPQVLGEIMDYFLAHDEVVVHEAQASAESAEREASDAEPEETQEIIAEIKQMIETHIRPAVAQDGGDIIFDRFEKGVVYLELQGACSGCPSSTVTLKNGIENMLRHYIPEVQEVQAIN